MQIDRVRPAQKGSVKGAIIVPHKQLSLQKDIVEASSKQKDSFHNDPLTGQNPGGTIDFTDLEKSQFFTIFMAIGEMGKAFRTQSNTSTTMMDLSTLMTQKLEKYLSLQVAQQKIQQKAIAAYNNSHPTWLKYMEQVGMLIGSVMMGAMTGGLAGAIAVGVIGITFDALDDIKVDKDGTETVWDVMFKGCSPTEKFFGKLGIMLVVSALAGVGTGLSLAGDDATEAVTGEALDDVEGETGEVSEENSTLKDKKVLGNKPKTRAFLVALEAVSKMLGSMQTHDITKGDGKDDTFGMFGDLAIAHGDSAKASKNWDTGFTWGISIALMIVQFGGTYVINKVTQTVEQGEWMQRIFNGTTYLGGATQAVSSGGQAISSAISAHYAYELEQISPILTKLERDGALVELLKTSINGATKASMQQMQGIMDAIISAIEGYSTQLSQGV